MEKLFTAARILPQEPAGRVQRIPYCVSLVPCTQYAARYGSGDGDVSTVGGEMLVGAGVAVGVAVGGGVADGGNGEAVGVADDGVADGGSGVSEGDTLGLAVGVGVGGCDVLVTVGVTEGGVGLGPMVGVAVTVGIRVGVGLATVAVGVGGVMPGEVADGVTEGTRVRVAVGMTIRNGTYIPCPTRSV